MRENRANCVEGEGRQFGRNVNIPEAMPPIDKATEQRLLPEAPEHMTFRGRYEQLDAKVIELAGIEQLPAGTEVKMLDFAGGVLPTGSPTAHDLVERFDSLQQNLHITVVDQRVETDFKVQDEDISYASSLESLPAGNFQQFDVVRALHLIEHVSPEEYEKIRRELLSWLKEGGLFVGTQMFEYERSQDRGFRMFPSVTKIMQKREDEMAPIGLFPDTAVPWPRSRMARREEYDELRAAVGNGTQQLGAELNLKGFNEVLDWLNKSVSGGISALEQERALLSLRTTEHVQDTLRDIAKMSEDTAKVFSERSFAGVDEDRIEQERKTTLKRMRKTLFGFI